MPKLPKTHFITVHWQNPQWVDVQLQQIHRHAERASVYAYLNGIDPEPYRDRFAYCGTHEIQSHAIKLNLMAELVCREADEADLLVFLDGDAYPVASVDALAVRLSEQKPLIAVRRDENNGDPQPHPCFCVTTVGFWNRIRGDWRSGYRWTGVDGRRVTDVGGNLLGLLREAGVAWEPLLRSNARNLHEMWFGVYGGMVYHHGAAFWDQPFARAEEGKLRLNARERALKRVLDAMPARIRNGILDPIHPVRAKRRALVRENQALSATMQELAVNDPDRLLRILTTTEPDPVIEALAPAQGEL